MNYLAHALLAEPHRYSIIGNIAGDHVKGRLEHHALHPRVADGVRRHRRVDALTDGNPWYRSSVARFSPAHRRVAPIVLDVLFDHFLFDAWGEHSDLNRDAFIDSVYAVLMANQSHLPEGFAQRAPMWVRSDWLRAYATMEGVAAVLERLARRARRSLPISETLDEARRLEEALRTAFSVVFSEVRSRIDGIEPVLTYTQGPS